MKFFGTFWCIQTVECVFITKESCGPKHKKTAIMKTENVTINERLVFPPIRMKQIKLPLRNSQAFIEFWRIVLDSLISSVIMYGLESAGRIILTELAFISNEIESSVRFDSCMYRDPLQLLNVPFQNILNCGQIYNYRLHWQLLLLLDKFSSFPPSCAHYIQQIWTHVGISSTDSKCGRIVWIPRGRRFNIW